MSLALLPLLLATSLAVLIPNKQIEYLSQPGQLYAGDKNTLTDLGTVAEELKDLVGKNYNRHSAPKLHSALKSHSAPQSPHSAPKFCTRPGSHFVIIHICPMQATLALQGHQTWKKKSK